MLITEQILLEMRREASILRSARFLTDFEKGIVQGIKFCSAIVKRYTKKAVAAQFQEWEERKRPAWKAAQFRRSINMALGLLHRNNRANAIVVLQNAANHRCKP